MDQATSRRGFLAGAASFGLTGNAFARALADGTLPPKSPAGVATTAMAMHMTGLDVQPGMRDTPVRYLEFCRSLGAGGVQHALRSDVPAFRRRLEELGMYYEGEAALPPRLDSDLSAFEQSVKTSAELGATCMRAVSRPPQRQGSTGRRYETFHSYQDYKAWQAEADAIIMRCLPIAHRYKVAIALENHKDRTAEEHLAFLKRVDSEYLGALVDPGNNMSMLEDAEATVRALAPYAKACSLKDMGVAPYEEGFLLSEVPFGTGINDQRKLFAILRRHNPRINPVTELITRDPLKVPILKDSYFASLPDRRARRDRWMAMVKAKQSKLPYVSHLPAAERLKAEAENNRRVFDWGRRWLKA
jgi:sugar phosphate isomerase/epimerase